MHHSFGIHAPLLLLGAPAAQAGGCYGSSCRPAPCQGSSCYTLVQTPPVYGSVAETYVARPEQVQAQVIPAEYDTVTEKVMVHPARQIAHHRPAQYGVVSEKVMLSPGGKRWEVSRDAHGRMVGCWVETPAQYGYRQRTVEIAPASVYYEIVPPVYSPSPAQGDDAAPTQVVRHTIPAVYETRHRKVLLQPGLQPLGPRRLLNLTARPYRHG